MSLAVFETYLNLAEQAVAHKALLPALIDPAELESALTCNCVVLLHSQMEQAIRKAVMLRCARSTDLQIRAFAHDVAQEKTGKLGITHLNQTLNRFCSSYKQAFQDELNTSGLNIAWDSIVNQRKRIAHDGDPVSLTLAELRQFYEGIRKVLGFYARALGLTDLEIQSISPLIVV